MSNTPTPDQGGAATAPDAAPQGQDGTAPEPGAAPAAADDLDLNAGGEQPAGGDDLDLNADGGKGDGDGEGDGEGADAYRGAPEVEEGGDILAAYGEFTVPEGYEQLDTDSLREFLPLAQKLDLSKDGVQELVNFEAQRRAAAVGQWDVLRESWAEQTRADPEVAAAMREQVRLPDGKSTNPIRAAYNAKVPGPDGRAVPLVDQEMRDVMAQFRLTHHPAFQRLFARLGRMGVGVTDAPGREAPSAEPKSIEERLYPDYAKGSS